MSIAEKLGNEGAEKLSVLCDLESVVTRFVKQSNLRYEVGNGWMALLEPLVALRLNKEDLYGAFYNMVHRFVPRYACRIVYSSKSIKRII